MFMKLNKSQRKRSITDETFQNYLAFLLYQFAQLSSVNLKQQK